MAINPDLSKLALALEYADVAAGLYLMGGSEHAARLMAAAAERLLGDLSRLAHSLPPSDEARRLLLEVALRHESPETLPESHARQRQRQPALERTALAGQLIDEQARQETATLLRACWYALESLGLESVAPDRLQDSIDRSTIYGLD